MQHTVHTACTPALTADQHQDNRENLLVVRVRRHVAEAHRDEPGEAKVEASAVPALQQTVLTYNQLGLAQIEQQNVFFLENYFFIWQMVDLNNPRLDLCLVWWGGTY